MCHFTLRPKLFFGLLVAALAFALGLFAAGLWPRRAASPPAPHAAPAPSRATVSVRDTFAGGAEEEKAEFEGPCKN